jgi:polygalacturonase
VVLAASNGKRSFVSGPLVLKQRRDLLIDAGATLHASSDPAFVRPRRRHLRHQRPERARLPP